MRRNNYLVGYEGEYQAVYGKERIKGIESPQGWISPMTLLQAKKLAKEILTRYGKRIIKPVIYKLEKV